VHAVNVSASGVDGLICAYVLDRRGAGRPLDWAGVRQWSPEQGILWVHLDYTEPVAHNWIKEMSEVPPTVAESLITEESRPRTLNVSDGLLVTLRGVNTNPGAVPEDMVSIRVWLEQDRIITCRHRRLLSVNDVREEVNEGLGPVSSGDFLVHLIDRLADRIGVVVDQLDETIEELESKNTDMSTEQLRKRLSELRRETARIRRYLAPQRDALDRLYRQSGGLLSEAEAAGMREHADRITRYLEDLDLTRERTMVVQEDLLSQLSHEQNSRMYVLSVVAAVFLPLTFVTGLLGMNVGGLPGTQNPYAFLQMVVAMFFMAIVLVVFFRWRKWI